MKRLAIVVGLWVVAALSCANDGSDSGALSCELDQDCGGARPCVAGRCVSDAGSPESAGGGADAPSLGGQPSASGSTSMGGARLGEGGEAPPESGRSSGGRAPVGGATAGGVGGSPQEPNLACADRFWQAVQRVGGDSTELFHSVPSGVSIAGDGSAFMAWLSMDSTFNHVRANASRYTPASGWEPHLQFDEWNLSDTPYYGGPDGTPVVAASENGDAMVLWQPWKLWPHPGGSWMSMRYASGWQTPVPMQEPAEFATMYTVGADAHGNFVAAWLGRNGDGTAVNMARYTRGAGWGSTEKVADYAASSIDLSTEPDGKALVVWADGGEVVAERFDPSLGWSGPETLLEDTIAPYQVEAPRGAIGRDGSAAVTWSIARSDIWHSTVLTFSGSWSPAVDLGGTAEPGLPVRSPYAIATNADGTFMVAWCEPDGTYTSQFTPEGSWSPRTRLSLPAGIATGSAHWDPQIAMNENGDAIVTWIELSQKDDTPSLLAATYSPSSGWTAPTLLDQRNEIYALRPTMDACGNATLVWGARNFDDVMAARRAHGSWSSPLKLGSGRAWALGVGSNGEVVASWLHGDEAAPAARVLTLPELDPCVVKVCDTPPDATCESPTLLKTYDTAGSCAMGQCSYATLGIACACQDGVCASPPDAICKDPNTLTTYAVVGACSAGGCNYAPTDTHCRFGCESGGCKPDPCAGVTCNTPPADECQGGSVKWEYVSVGGCSAGSCFYGASAVNCPDNTLCAGQGVCALCKTDVSCGPYCQPCGERRCKDLGTASKCVHCFSNADCSWPTPNCNLADFCEAPSP